MQTGNRWLGLCLHWGRTSRFGSFLVPAALFSQHPRVITLFEFGFVREAVNKLGCFPSDELPLPNLRMTSRAVMLDSMHTASWVSGSVGQKAR